jgi:hypothetical protein
MKELENFINIYNESNNCPNCGKKVNDSKCPFCGEINKKLEIAIQEVLHYISDLNLKELKLDEVSILLNKIKSFNIPVINGLLEQSNLTSIINDALVNREKLDDNLYEFLVSNGIDDNAKIVEIDNIFKHVLLRDCKYSPEFIKNLLIFFTEYQAKKFIIDPKVLVNDMQQDNCCAYMSSNVITLDNQMLENFCKYGTVETISNIFHKIAHSWQYQRAEVTHDLTYADLEKAKERVIAQNDYHYNDENLERISYEADAKIMECYFTLAYLNRIGLHLNNNLFYQRKMDNAMMALRDKQRIYKGKRLTVDEIFNQVITFNPTLLEKYPQFKVEYKVENNSIRIKTREERKTDEINYIKVEGKDPLEIHSLYQTLEENEDLEDIKKSVI